MVKGKTKEKEKCKRKRDNKKGKEKEKKQGNNKKIGRFDSLNCFQIGNRNQDESKCKKWKVKS